MFITFSNANVIVNVQLFNLIFFFSFGDSIKHFRFKIIIRWQSYLFILYHIRYNVCIIINVIF